MNEVPGKEDKVTDAHEQKNEYMNEWMNEVPGKEDKVTGVHEQGQVDVLVGDAALKSGRLNLK